MTSIVALSWKFRSFFFFEKRKRNNFAIVLIVFVSLVVFALVRIKLKGLSTANAGLLHDWTLAVSHDNYHSRRTAFKI